MIGPNATTTTTSADGALHYPTRAEENANFPFFSLLLFLNRRTTCALCNYSGLEEISDYDCNQLQGWQGRLLRFHTCTMHADEQYTMHSFFLVEHSLLIRREREQIKYLEGKKQTTRLSKLVRSSACPPSILSWKLMQKLLGKLLPLSKYKVF